MSKQFAEFRVGDVFEIKGTKSTDAGNLTLKNSGEYEFVGRTLTNNGVQGYCANLGFDPNPGKEISISQVGTIVALWRQNPYYTSQNIVRCYLNNAKMNTRIGMFLVTCLNSHLKHFVGYRTPKIVDIEGFTITLPVTDESAGTESPEPDWEYMETYIKEIEAKYLDSVVKYNKRNGEILDTLYPDYNGSAPEAYDYAEFRVGDVFEVVTGSMVKNLKEGIIPRINPTEQNNGIGSWIEDNNHLARYFEDFVSVSFLGNVFYQGQRSSLEMKVHGLKRKDGVFGHRKGTYVATSVSKAISGVYNYGMQLSSEKLKGVTITLPVTPGGDPDWEYMSAKQRERERDYKKNRALRAAQEEKLLRRIADHHNR